MVSLTEHIPQKIILYRDMLKRLISKKQGSLIYELCVLVVIDCVLLAAIVWELWLACSKLLPILNKALGLS